MNNIFSPINKSLEDITQKEQHLSKNVGRKMLTKLKPFGKIRTLGYVEVSQMRKHIASDHLHMTR